MDIFRFSRSPRQWFVLVLLVMFLVPTLISCGQLRHRPENDTESRETESSEEKPFEPSWKSLSNYRTPEWFRDAKFGIFMHWGVETIPGSHGANDGWYARHMYMRPEDFQSTDKSYQGTYEFHLDHFGHPSEFGFKDFIPRWKAEAFDPLSLVKFYRSVGARYVVPMAVHHDNFDNYDSTHQPWNAVNMGPEQDLIGLWREACEEVGLRFGVSSHAARTPNWYNPAYGGDGGGAYDANLTKADGAGRWWEGYDPEDLYGPPPDKPALEYARRWYKRTKELVDAYEPDLLYFDGTLPFGGYGLRIGAYYYNRNIERNGRLEAVMNLKWMERRSAVKEVEKGTTTNIQSRPWQAGTTLQPGWFWQKGVPLRLDGGLVVDKLVDIVSKNGNLLLNVGPKPDGTIPEDQRRELEVIGEWLEVNGEAIYGTRPWTVYGEGPTQLEEGNFNERTLDDQPFTSRDVRFTTKGDTLYAIVLAWPEEGHVSIEHLGSTRARGFGPIKRIGLLGSDADLKWSRREDELTVQFPDRKPCRHAFVLKIVPAGSG